MIPYVCSFCSFMCPCLMINHKVMDFSSIIISESSALISWFTQNGASLFYFSEEAELSEVCKACGFGGHLLCCDTCPLLFHIECVVPPLKKVPRGKWSCPKCKVVKGEHCCINFNCQNGKWAGIRFK